jgi:hypothetical protein
LTIEFAREFATRAHEGQKRKGGDRPYISHPMAVADGLARLYGRDDLTIAGLLHDVVEDTPMTIAAIATLFGDYVGELVAGVTKGPGGLDLPTPPLTDVDRDVLRIKGADLTSNLTETAHDIERGHFVWARFIRGRGKLDVWAHEIGRVGNLTVGPEAHKADRELVYPLQDLFEKVKGLATIVTDEEKATLAAIEANLPDGALGLPLQADPVTGWGGR